MIPPARAAAILARMLPTFIVIGAMKAGTTSLWSYLREHPEVFVPPLKEVNFFIDGPHWDLGIRWYESLFEGGSDAKARGEASPSYSMAPHFAEVPERIARVAPDAALVYLVRHPVERMRSQWAHRVAMGRERRPAEVALRDRNYLDLSRYAFQLERYLAHFARDRILVLTSESLLEDRLETMRRVYDFVGVDPGRVPAAIDQEIHRTDEKPLRAPLRAWLESRGRMGAVRTLVPAKLRAWYTRRATRSLPDASVSPALRAELEATLRPEVARLRELVGPEIDRWGMLAPR